MYIILYNATSLYVCNHLIRELACATFGVKTSTASFISPYSMLLFHIQPYISTWTSSDLLDEPSGAFKTSSFRHFLQKSIFSGVASEPFSSFQPVLHVYICPFLFFSSISSERASKRASIQLRISSTPSVPSAPSDLFCTFQCIATVFFFPA